MPVSGGPDVESRNDRGMPNPPRKGEAEGGAKGGDPMVTRRDRSEERFRAVARASGRVVWSLHADGRMAGDSESWREFTGQNAEESRGYGWLDAVTSAGRQELRSYFARADAAGRHEEEFRVQLRRADGRTVTAAFRIAAVASEGDRVSEWVCTSEDLSEKEDVVAALHDCERNYQLLIDSFPSAVYTCDAEGRILQFNAPAAELWGREPVIGQDLWCGSWKIFNPDGTPLPLDECPMAIAIREGRCVRGREIVIERPDGTRAHVMPMPQPLFDGQGTIIGAVNMLLDLTERRRTDELNALLAAIVQNSDDAIISKDLDGVIRSWNAGAERLFGYTAGEAIGKPIAMLVPPDRQEEEPFILSRIRGGIRMEHFETVRRRKDGTLVEISLTVSPVKNSDGRIIGASKIARDITEQRRTARELERVRDEALAASRAKDEFLAGLSHELRTPLNPVLLLASDGASDATLPGRVRADFDVIRKNISLEARLIDDLLDLTRIARGKLSLDLLACDVHQVLRDAVAVVQPDLEQKRITLSYELSAEKPCVTGDAVRLQQVFWNLLRNAVHFTPEGGAICVRTWPEEQSRRLAIAIADSGVGISAGDLNRIFDAFVQGEQGSAAVGRQAGGLGLGLAISRQLVEMHGGSIHASSPGVGKGATFVVRLPLRTVSTDGDGIAPEAQVDDSSVGVHAGAQGPEGADRHSASRGRLLVVEDHVSTRDALRRLLARRSFEVFTAGSVEEALAFAERERFDFVISDIGLPDADGFALMTRLQTVQPGIRGIALSGYGTENDIALARRAGFLDHLTKPVRVSLLDQALERLIREAPDRPQEEWPGSASRGDR